MTRGLNKVMIIGRLGRDPEMRYTPNGRPVTAFSVAVNRSWVAGDGDKREETEWFNVVAWGNLAEICKQYLAKGQQVYVEGRLQTRNYKDKEGVEKWRTEVVANQLLFLGSGDRGAGAGAGAGAGPRKSEGACPAQGGPPPGEDALSSDNGGFVDDDLFF